MSLIVAVWKGQGGTLQIEKPSSPGAGEDGLCSFSFRQLSPGFLTRRVRRLSRITTLAVALTILTACDSAEDRAEGHFQTALSFLQAGEVEPALVEFRKVFQLDGSHEEARQIYARIERDQGRMVSAFSHYLRLVEHHPDNIEARRALAEIALGADDLDTVRRHIPAGLRVAPEDDVILSINNALKYFDAITERNPTARELAVVEAERMLDQNPLLFGAWKVTISEQILQENWEGALAQIDGAFAALARPNESLHFQRLEALRHLNDVEALEAQILSMLDMFPDRTELKEELVALYERQRKLDEAEAFLRGENSGGLPEIEPTRRLIEFLEAYRGPRIAIAELDRIIAMGGDNQRAFRAMRARLNFSSGTTIDAIAELRQLLIDADDSPLTQEIKVSLGQILLTTGGAPEGRALIEDVLSQERANLEAVKLKADWLIDDENTTSAIVLLREALGHAPDDPELLISLARAYEVNGDRQLMGEMLLRAVEASGRAASVSLRYVGYLLEAENYAAAEGVLIEALRESPGDLTLLTMLGKIYLTTGNWDRIGNVVESLQNVEGGDALALATELSAKKREAESWAVEMANFLDDLSRDPKLTNSADIALIRSMLAKNDSTGARLRLASLLEANPESVDLRFVDAHAKSIEGKSAAARRTYLDLLKDNVEREQLWMALYRLDAKTDNAELASRTLENALEALPDSANLLWLRAGELELAGDVDGAIAIYENLYAKNPSSSIVSNNLASLLAMHRDDPESLERAHDVARRLRGSDVGEFQDTYGWIAYRRGEYDEAKAHLEYASKALPGNSAVFFHLAMAEAKLKNDGAALSAFRRSLALADADDPPPFVDVVTSEIERLISIGTEKGRGSGQ